MNLLSALISGAPASPVCNTEDIYRLLISVLPIFTDISERTRDNLPDPDCDDTLTETWNFYLHFYTVVFNLYAVLVKWNPTESVQRLSTDEAEIRKNVMRVLDELENRFVSQKGKEAGPAFRRLRFECRKDETYPKLRALRRALPEDGVLAQNFLADVDNIIRVMNKSARKQQALLQNLQQALDFFHTLQPFASESDSPCPIRFLDYPLNHVRTLTKTLFDVLQGNWCCQCPSSAFHVSRKARLNLTKHQRFETSPTHGQVISTREARFRIWFPTISQDLEWQDTEISVYSRDREKSEHREVENGLCMIIQGVKAGIRPRMVVYSQKLWQLQADVESNRLSLPRVRDGEFMPLKNLLGANENGRESLISSMEGKDRLTLSFVLATSLLHFYSGPWLRASLSSENICFLVSNQRSSPDITKPYLTTSCSSRTQGAPKRDLNQPHRFPDILSLGILLLEIARGTPINFEEHEDRCVVALGCMDRWTRTCRTGRFRTIPEGLCHAILACIDPAELRINGLDKMLIDDSEVRKYIFERVLYPLGDALSTAYEIDLNTLHAHIYQAKEVSGIGSFDHQEKHGKEKAEAAAQWFGYLDGVHDLFYKCQHRCRNLGEAATKATRVKVAVLDTGLQLPEAFQVNYISEKRINLQQSETFVPVSEGDATHEWNVDCDGHGSRVGQIILRAAPSVDLHVAKVFKTSRDLEDPRLAMQVHKSIIDAINRATNEWEVDMIVMCFGFDEPIPLIRKAIEHALRAERPPLFFAATRNDGAHKHMAWPAKDMSVFGISSTDSNGDASPFNPLDEDAQPILYAFGDGVPVEVAVLGNPDKNTTKYVSGTSYATPVAAALAANLLGCIRMVVDTLPPEDRADYSHVPGDLQRMSGMLAVLRHRMGKRHNCGVKSLLPWNFLNVEGLDKNKILEDVAETLKKR